ncbi:carboxymuconolactone decarboxylase family protein [Methanobrevibacter sp.]|uniref:carboxymuconolactone decarboxylase family protein n=1 Tax=Methanobrevibacter sp. TaxID=66852 RepID=UPI00388ECE49
MSNFNDEEKRLDPEFTQLFDEFAFSEVPGSNDIDEKTRYVVILASLLGCQGVDEFRAILPLALKALSPLEIKEIIYQSTAYLGIGRVYPFIGVANEVMKVEGVELPLPGQSTTTPENRLEKGSQAQVDLFGEQMKDFWKASDINRFLADNCFGDYYTREGLDYKTRELITFCFLASLGGCEGQLMAHTSANFMHGNGKDFLIDVVSQMVPYIGYPRSLNAITIINKVAEQLEE